MPKKKKHGRGRDPRRQRRQAALTRAPYGAEAQALFQDLRRALRSEHPLELLEMVSGMLEVTDPRSQDPFARDAPWLSLVDLAESFIGTPYAETTAALTVLRTLTTDEVLAARIDRELANRHHPMPPWLTGLHQVRVEPDVWFMTHVLGDGDDYLAGVTLPSGHAVSALIYVDHNLGTVVKDAFLVPQPLEDLALTVGGLIEEPDQTLTRTDPAGARAVIEAAIEDGARFYPPLTSDTWPMSRPLVEWIVRMLPAGGVVPARKEWTEAEVAAISADFFASPLGAALDDEDHRGLLDNVLWFGTDYSTGNPLQWSSVTVELLLLDWAPRKIVANAALLSKLPELLRAFIRYCHQREGIRDALTRGTLAAVDELEPEYQRLIRSARPQGPAALLAWMWDAQHDPAAAATPGELMLAQLDRQVGGRLVLQNLDVEPLPDEPFEWAGIPEDIRPAVAEVLGLCDKCADELLDVEHRTAMRRFLSRTAVADPAIFRRKSSPQRTAAAIAWVICRANDTTGDAGDISVQELLDWFGVKGSVSERAQPMLRANGLEPPGRFGSLALGSPDLLTSLRRSEIATARDHWLDVQS